MLHMIRIIPIYAVFLCALACCSESDPNRDQPSSNSNIHPDIKSYILKYVDNLNQDDRYYHYVLHSQNTYNLTANDHPLNIALSIIKSDNTARAHEQWLGIISVEYRGKTQHLSVPHVSFWINPKATIKAAVSRQIELVISIVLSSDLRQGYGTYDCMLIRFGDTSLVTLYKCCFKEQPYSDKMRVDLDVSSKHIKIDIQHPCNYDLKNNPPEEYYAVNNINSNIRSGALEHSGTKHSHPG